MEAPVKVSQDSQSGLGRDAMEASVKVSQDSQSGLGGPTLRNGLGHGSTDSYITPTAVS